MKIKFYLDKLLPKVHLVLAHALSFQYHMIIVRNFKCTLIVGHIKNVGPPVVQLTWDHRVIWIKSNLVEPILIRKDRPLTREAQLNISKQTVHIEMTNVKSRMGFSRTMRLRENDSSFNKFPLMPVATGLNLALIGISFLYKNTLKKLLSIKAPFLSPLIGIHGSGP